MAQQINLCTVTVSTERQSFSARTMAAATLAFVVLGGGLCGSWVWNLQKATQGYTATLADQARDIQGLHTALSEMRASAAPMDAALQQQLQAKRTELAQGQQLIQALRQGLAEPGAGHSDRLRLLASTIPDQAWVTSVQADAGQMDIAGFTLDPAVLNDWLGRMAASPLLQGLRLAAVQVENVAQSAAPMPGGTNLMPAGALATAQAAIGPRAAWAFRIVHSSAPSMSPTPEQGSKP